MQTYDYAPPRIGAVKGAAAPEKPKGKAAKKPGIVARARAKKKGSHCK